MRRAISPAICTHVTSTPLEVAICSALRSFSSEDLATEALRKLPAWYHLSRTTPSTGLRLECTLNTFMNMLIFSASRSRYGSRVFSTTRTRPSAGDSTALGCDGTARGGSRKNCTMNTTTTQTGTATNHQPATESASAASADIATKGQPSRAMMGCG